MTPSAKKKISISSLVLKKTQKRNHMEVFNLWNTSYACWEELREILYPRQQYSWNCFPEVLLFCAVLYLLSRNLLILKISWFPVTSQHLLFPLTTVLQQEGSLPSPQTPLKKAKPANSKIQYQNPQPFIKYSKKGTKRWKLAHIGKNPPNFAPGKAATRTCY